MPDLTINGTKHDLDVDPDMPLLWVLRDHVDLTGTKFGCGIAQCGACTIHLDGTPVLACVTPVAAAEGARITTIEGVAGPVADAVREAWAAREVAQCGYCQPGQIMAAISLLTENPHPNDADIDAAMEGNICRCGTYQRIRAAIHDAAAKLG